MGTDRDFIRIRPANYVRKSNKLEVKWLTVLWFVRGYYFIQRIIVTISYSFRNPFIDSVPLEPRAGGRSQIVEGHLLNPCLKKWEVLCSERSV